MTLEALQGVRILVVEDEVMIALMIEGLLIGYGCTVVGPIARLAPAQEAARGGGFDCAILDVNLKGERVHPVADILAERGIPFAFITGYGDAGNGARFDGRPVLHKPFKHQELQALLTSLVAAG